MLTGPVVALGGHNPQAGGVDKLAAAQVEHDGSSDRAGDRLEVRAGVTGLDTFVSVAFASSVSVEVEAAAHPADRSLLDVST
ncbi:MAG: hypothetical protein ACEQSX_18330 [Baekduiaceae bacterium]